MKRLLQLAADFAAIPLFIVLVLLELLDEENSE